MFRKYIFIYISLLFASAKGILFLPLWLGCLLISLYFDCSARTSSTLWNRSSESGHLCFVPVCKVEAFNLSPVSMILALNSLYMASIMLSYVPSIPICWEFLSSKDVVLSNACSVSTEMVLWFLSFILLKWYNVAHIAYVVDSSLYWRDKSHLVLVLFSH